MALLQMKLQKKKVFEIFMAYFLPQHHGEMYAEQMINKILDDNKGDSPEFRTYWPLTSYMYRSKFLTGALIILRKDCVLPLLVSFRITASLLILDLFILSKTLFGERVFRIFD